MTRLEPNLRAPNLRAPNLRKGVATIMVALALTALAALPVGAETSAWTSKLDVPETAPAAPKGAGKSGTGEPRPAPVAKPATEPKRAAPPGEAAAKSAAKVATPQAPPREAGARANPAKPATIPNLPTALPPPVGETAAAAYELFDQGRFLSALATAVKAVQQKGEPEAYTLIGRIYEEGLGVGRNAEVAIEWYAQGAELGDLNAQFSLGLMYAEGRGAAKNLARAAAAFEASAKQGHQVAQYNLGMIYAHGDGRDEDFAQAAHWLEKAAVQGHAPAQYDLASLYYEGRGVPVDEEKAALWLGKAAKAGIPAAQLEYARLLVKGQGVPKPSDQGKAPDVLKQEREAEAFGLIRAAALKGNVVAQNRLARFYFFGVVVEGDLVEGAKWHLIARQAGVADLAMDNLLGKMAKDQRAKAEKAAADWLVRAATE